MEGTGTSRWNSIERWSPTLFLIGGGLLVGHAAMLSVQAFSTLPTPPDLFGPTGHLVALVGLFGLYPLLVDRRPILARLAGSVAIIGVGSWTVLTVTRMLAVGGVLTSVSNVLPDAFFMVVFGSTILTYTLFGIASLHVDSGTSIVGAFLLAPAVLLVVALAASAVMGVTAAEGFLIGWGLALSILTLGYVLRTRNRSTTQVVRSGDVSVR